MIARPSLMLLMASAATLSAVANGVTAATPQTSQQDASQASAPKTRLGSAIEQDMAQRDQQAAERRRSLQLREQAAVAAEARLQASMASQREAAAEGDAAAGAEAEAEGVQYDELARIYQSMRPKNAAVVFEQLTMDVQVEVAKRMRERNTALIMANMTPEGAAKLTMALARGRAVDEAQPAAARPQAR
ncbi:MotE family protein [Stakelama tenebrarum]|uniref:Magnesium transporter MgtE intracellular domain-containing protein n=1 Tax=Stakelama tenebrarum TaxID=2711215 RepID=A0A6G6Y415_9SPHN|nr:hypothetical protein [Sphingosinithalassobacter tenebrarum]QIG79672.1 hypothetical protein G5C33_07620 [Sphingosinithalassobacter tenebrarum]